MAWHWFAAALLVSGALVLASLQLHRKGRPAAKGVDVAALVWLFCLVNFVPAQAQWLTGLLMFVGCFHLGVLMGWLPIRRVGD